jgi:hypothetical protein
LIVQHLNYYFCPSILVKTYLKFIHKKLKLIKKYMSNAITPKNQNYAQWYIDIVKRAGLADNSAVRGCMVIKPYGRNFGFGSPYAGLGWGSRNFWNPYSGWGFGSFGGFYPTWGGGNTYIQNNHINIVDNSRTYFGRRGNASNYLPRLNDGRRPEAATPTGGVRTNTNKTVAGSTLTAPRRQSSTVNANRTSPTSRTRVSSGQKLPTSASTIYDRNRTISRSSNGNRSVGATRRTTAPRSVMPRTSTPRSNSYNNRTNSPVRSSSGVNRSSSAPSRSVSPPSRNSSSSTTRSSSSGGVRTSSRRGNN